MAQHNILGKLGERMAVFYLKKKGYNILEINWTFQNAEIDIIAYKNKILSIVEVKTRSNLDFGSPQDFVNFRKISLLKKAANEYIIQKNLDLEVQFDIISIYKNNKNFEIKKLENAFYYF